MKLRFKKKRELGTLSSQDADRTDHKSDDPQSRVAQRAFELYMQRGCQEGHAVEDWLEAEREILGRKD